MSFCSFFFSSARYSTVYGSMLGHFEQSILRKLSLFACSSAPTAVVLRLTCVLVDEFKNHQSQTIQRTITRVSFPVYIYETPYASRTTWLTRAMLFSVDS